jgi:hypothetical protein
MDCLTTQGFMKLWYAVFWISGCGFATGVILYIIDFFYTWKEITKPLIILFSLSKEFSKKD